ncbi:uncharacterized protein, partial [Procambarus clarkii]|uniref:uncharacterized protein n=1 Tax=Procambarus clarkii TaxID=6728 RepID=UPI0037444461
SGDAAAILSFIGEASAQGKTGGADKWDPLLLWVRPQPCCLQALAAHVRQASLSALASIGCGTGLLEWLISATTGLSVTGYEVNCGWWSSRYAPPTFIPFTYVDPDDCPPAVPPSHALMCCYFNNGQVFRQYVAAYKGPVLIIIGSVNGSHHHTEPHPLDYVHVHPWILTHTHHISQDDLLACYVRDCSKEGMHREPSV